jgi:hypothetical protein
MPATKEKQSCNLTCYKKTEEKTFWMAAGGMFLEVPAWSDCEDRRSENLHL